MPISKIVTNSIDSTFVNSITDLENTVAILGLKEAVTANRVANNLGNAFIDIFQDSSGIANTTNTTWSSSEYVGTTLIESYGTLISVSQSNFNSRGRESWTGDDVTFNASPDVDAGVQSAGGSTPIQLSANTPFQFQFTTSDNQYGPHVALIPYSAGTTSYSQGPLSTLLGTVRLVTGSLTGSTLGYNTNGSSFTDIHTGGNYRGATFLFRRSAAGILQVLQNGSQIGSNTNILTSGYQMWLAGQGGHTSSVSNIQYSNGSISLISSGEFIGTTQTSTSTVNRMSIVILYKNQVGTATLNTDLSVQLSANGGTNYTTATLTDGGTFSSGIKIAIANAVTITNTGTSPKYKLSLANQVYNTKETQIWGIGLLY